MADGPREKVLTDANLTALFGIPIRLDKEGRPEVLG